MSGSSIASFCNLCKHLNITSNPFSFESNNNFIDQSYFIAGEHVQNGDHSDAHISTFSHSSKEVSANVRIRIKISHYILIHIHKSWSTAMLGRRLSDSAAARNVAPHQESIYSAYPSNIPLPQNFTRNIWSGIVILKCCIFVLFTGCFHGGFSQKRQEKEEGSSHSIILEKEERKEEGWIINYNPEHAQTAVASVAFVRFKFNWWRPRSEERNQQQQQQQQRNKSANWNDHPSNPTLTRTRVNRTNTHAYIFYDNIENNQQPKPTNSTIYILNW